MHRVQGIAHIPSVVTSHGRNLAARTYSKCPNFRPQLAPTRRYIARTIPTETSSSPRLPTLAAPSLSSAQQPTHVHLVSSFLSSKGILKISLACPDPESHYLEDLLKSLHKHHGHGLPLSHSASRGWFWEIRPSASLFQVKNHQARSETMEVFPWHTDCSYEEAPPRFFALQMVHADRFGGGTLSVMQVEQITRRLSKESTAALMRAEYRIRVPPEFNKDPGQTSIVGSLLALDPHDGSTMVRFREEIVTPLTPSAEAALEELRGTLRRLEEEEQEPGAILRLSAQDLPERSILVLDNHRWLHARSAVKDPQRHLRRVRWNPVPFASRVEV
ncbi:hypothetical protein BDW71DRAFT_170671 [Aspergillus fruticulosus]